MTVKDRLHQLVDELSEDEAGRALAALERLRAGVSPLAQTLDAAPADDAPRTPEEDAGAAEAVAEYRRGEARPLEEALRELG